jgi:hypothetical protein
LANSSMKGATITVEHIVADKMVKSMHNMSVRDEKKITNGTLTMMPEIKKKINSLIFGL